MTPFRWTLVVAAAVVATLMLPSVAKAESLCDLPQCECDETQSEVRCSCRKQPNESQELVLREQGPGHVPRVATSVSVTNCAAVKVMATAFDGARSLWSVEIASVGRLDMADEAFGWSDRNSNNAHSHQTGPTVTITNVTAVPEVPSYAFRGRLRAVVFDRVNVHAVRPFAFSSLTGTTGRIEFRDTVFGLVEQQAFKKFTVNEFVMRGCRFDGPAPSRMLTEITVHDELRLEDVRFTVVRSYAFRVHGPKVFRVRGSRAACVQSAAFEVKCRGPAFVEDNAFGRLERGAFSAITVDARAAHLQQHGGGGGGGAAEYQEFVFENNTVAEYENDALVFDTNGFRPRLDWLIVGRECACPARWRTDLVAFATDYPRHADRPAWTVEQAAWCPTPPGDEDGERGRLVRAQQYDEAHCAGSAGGAGGRGGGPGSLARFCATAGAVVAVAALAAALVYWAWCRRRKRAQWTNVPTTASSPLKTATCTTTTRSILKSAAAAGGKHGGGGGGGGSRHVMVMPEGKTYRETELHVIVETAGSADDPNHYRSTTNYQHHQQRTAAHHPLSSDL